ncbi:hypothetical protein BCR41DRAFT_392805 [Lobosporangium transversale]|uniref:Uncharacterized protein n=1 Tax=Lobosporangium transversale TaxID=64571 RepID=A0A1Y2GYU4_9FUNG|nr:hypothetical protein BCR41DRAFT_392805 [Lobosporangium transversale]ORZ27469.1 hypothetical protein BCR41DRAFT_392805 [Lobosporangium transversale]|eukprot:XP_021885196.1 hypothetical protein BCR41DRAFT_392805 [Lobosporangium transversale]
MLPKLSLPSVIILALIAVVTSSNAAPMLRKGASPAFLIRIPSSSSLRSWLLALLILERAPSSRRRILQGLLEKDEGDNEGEDGDDEGEGDEGDGDDDTKTATDKGSLV